MKKMEGKKAPNVVLKTRVRLPAKALAQAGDEKVKGPNLYRWQEVGTADIFAGKKIVLFALPGAFTPTCSSTHLPGYEKEYAKFKKLGMDEVYCLSVNDAFVMFQWAKAQAVKNVKMLPDGSGLFTAKMGLLVKKDNLGFGKRSWRYSMFVNDGVIVKMFIEPGFRDNAPNDPFKVSDAGTMRKYLESRR